MDEEEEDEEEESDTSVSPRRLGVVTRASRLEYSTGYNVERQRSLPFPFGSSHASPPLVPYPPPPSFVSYYSHTRTTAIKLSPHPPSSRSRSRSTPP